MTEIDDNALAYVFEYVGGNQSRFVAPVNRRFRNVYSSSAAAATTTNHTTTTTTFLEAGVEMDSCTRIMVQDCRERRIHNWVEHVSKAAAKRGHLNILRNYGKSSML